MKLEPVGLRLPPAAVVPASRTQAVATDISVAGSIVARGSREDWPPL